MAGGLAVKGPEGQFERDRICRACIFVCLCKNKLPVSYNDAKGLARIIPRPLLFEQMCDT